MIKGLRNRYKGTKGLIKKFFNKLKIKREKVIQ